LRERLAGKLVLFLGYDPRSPDLGLLVRHVLSGHLGDVDVRAFLAWPGAKSEHAWSDWPIRVIDAEPLALVEQLSP
jgi:hypothetical protein